MLVIRDTELQKHESQTRYFNWSNNNTGLVENIHLEIIIAIFCCVLKPNKSARPPLNLQLKF